MRMLLIPLYLVVLLGCQPKNEPLDVAARVSGAYAVQAYVIDGDTLYSSRGINKLGVTNFFVGVSRRTADTVAISYPQNIPNSFVVNLGTVPIGGIRIVTISEVSGKFQLSDGTKSPFVYESSIDGNRLYERTIGYNIDSLEARFRFDSLKSPYNPPLREIIISAQK